MKIPETFTSERNKEVTQEELEETIRKTLVDKILVENISKEIKKYLESEALAKRLNIGFRKTIDIIANNLKTTAGKELYPSREHPYQVRNNIKTDYETRESIFNQEIASIQEKIMELEPDLKEEEIIQNYSKCFSILSKETIYEVSISYTTNEKDVETGKTDQFKMDIYKRKVRNLFKRKLVKEGILELPLIDVYHDPVIYGTVKYAKFDHEHNTKILKALKELGYTYSVNITEEKR